MKIIISPAKKMKVDTDSFASTALPQYLAETETILAALRSHSYDELQTIWHCSDKIARENYERLQQLNLKDNLTPALMAFTGIQYQYMAPDLFTEPALRYVEENLRILSGFYGILRPFDGITPYRLEMQSDLNLAGQNLYQFWDNKLYDALSDNATEPIINLASQEYAKAIQPYLQPDNTFINIVFGQLIDGKIKTRATLAKMARGEIVRFIAENNVQTTDQLKHFDHLNYQFDEQWSTTDKLVFVKAN
ncbi:hypothetical protein LOSG293_380110 [Secundilactobacillus oryzae JCM 18671]|uniref:UPF0246 protein LOSG293_380110 n=1 Tax=Secundilactobacillus oryzae JCM 18671 TaxID=1291743 RepID=A0A081BKK1_9LACO|nr:peroxide stress protein YaaA [Secundilactobacillus oryzae]GAK48569.1 hypothetical protein LOSG293_380110 [Secundilactobacillus oryzae JCM 18671]